MVVQIILTARILSGSAHQASKVLIGALPILGMAPLWHTWAQQRNESFAEITTDEVTRSLPAKGTNRVFAEQDCARCSPCSRPVGVCSPTPPAG